MGKSQDTRRSLQSLPERSEAREEWPAGVWGRQPPLWLVSGGYRTSVKDAPQRGSSQIVMFINNQNNLNNNPH